MTEAEAVTAAVTAAVTEAEAVTGSAGRGQQPIVVTGAPTEEELAALLAVLAVLAARAGRAEPDDAGTAAERAAARRWVRAAGRSDTRRRTVPAWRRGPSARPGWG